MKNLKVLFILSLFVIFVSSCGQKSTTETTLLQQKSTGVTDGTSGSLNGNLCDEASGSLNINCSSTGSTTEKQEEEILEPSTLALPGCEWVKTSGFGVVFWAQKCDFGGRAKIQVSKSNEREGFITEYSTGGEFMKDTDVIRIFKTEGGKDSIISLLLGENTFSEKDNCTFTQIQGFGTGGEQFYFALTSPDPAINCGKYGLKDEETSHFIGFKSNPSTFIYINQKKQSPYIDEASIRTE